MLLGPEHTQVEVPFLNQLADLGWKVHGVNADEPSPGGRESFDDVFLMADLRKALRSINLRDGKPWLDDARIAQAINAISRLGAPKLLEANQRATHLLLKGTEVDGVEGWNQGRRQVIVFIDWDTPANNTFRALNQFRLTCPPGHANAEIIPDIVLFINGIPVGVVEAKSPALAHPLEKAIDQLQRYANRRRGLGIVDVNEGNARLFHYAQFTIATCGTQARVGTFSSLAEHYMAWKDSTPKPLEEVAERLGKTVDTLTQQQTLVAGMLTRAHLLDVLRHFTFFMQVGDRTIKAICRYQQFRAVHKAVHRMLTGKTREEDGERDRRGGIVFHTQGSGKSLTMVFLIRKMRAHPDLRRFKIVVVTDRRSLQKQLAATALLTGENLTRIKARTVGGVSVPGYQVLQDTLSQPGADLIFATIQKYRGALIDTDAVDDSDSEDAATQAPAKTEPLPELNTDASILVLVDEAHRSHTNTAHANLMRALPNCVKIGFTGTPIIMAKKKKTEAIFGTFIDRYPIRQAEADGATVRIIYEGRTDKGGVKGDKTLDALFEDMLVKRTPAEKVAIQRKYATQGHVTEAKALIAAKAKDMLRHYVEHVMPDGFKAQVVAVSRRATVRYFDAFCAARDALVAEIEGLPAALHDDADAAALDTEEGFLVRARRFLPTIKALQFAPVISGIQNDPIDPTGEWTTASKSDARITRFKRPLFGAGPNTFDHKKADPLAFLIVKSMLLTGFDAPIEQVMYLDRHIKEAELLQAVARVNRTYAKTVGDRVIKKQAGLVVDYYGIANHLEEALRAYDKVDVEGALHSLKDEIPTLRDRHRRVVQIFITRGIESLDETEACVELLEPEKLRAEFHVALRVFLVSLDRVLPRPEGLPYVNDAKTLAFIQACARNRYRSEERLIGKEVGEKVRALIDAHIVSKGINPLIPPIQITAAGFAAHVRKTRSPRAAASEMEHALRYHLRKNRERDPAHIEAMSARLNTILKTFAGRWTEMVAALTKLTEETLAGRSAEESYGLDAVHAPFFDLIKQAVVDEPDTETIERLRDLTLELVSTIKRDVRIVGFWDHRAHAREALRSTLFAALDVDLLPFEKLDAVADKLMQLAKARHDDLVR